MLEKQNKFLLKIQKRDVSFENFPEYIKIKKGEREFTFFCPKSTMNLTYLCYGTANVIVF